MRYLQKLSIFTAAAIVLLLASACSKTEVTGLWKKSDYTGGSLDSFMVVALTGEMSDKLLWENIMADRLRQEGLKAVTSVGAFPNARDIDEQQIMNYVDRNEIDGVLVTRLVDTRKEKVYHPPRGAYYGGAYGYYRRFNFYYPHAYEQVYSPGYTSTLTIVLLETNLYRVDTKELIWSMSTDTFEPRSFNQLVDSVSDKVVELLHRENLI